MALAFKFKRGVIKFNQVNKGFSQQAYNQLHQYRFCSTLSAFKSVLPKPQACSSLCRISCIPDPLLRCTALLLETWRNVICCGASEILSPLVLASFHWSLQPTRLLSLNWLKGDLGSAVRRITTSVRELLNPF